MHLCCPPGSDPAFGSQPGEAARTEETTFPSAEVRGPAPTHPRQPTRAPPARRTDPVGDEDLGASGIIRRWCQGCGGAIVKKSDIPYYIPYPLDSHCHTADARSATPGRHATAPFRDGHHRPTLPRRCYPKDMVQGMLHRAGVAIVLIATLLAPYGRCQSPSRAAAHDCCGHHSAPVASLKANCCTVRSELPAIVVEPGVLSPIAAHVSAAFVPAVAPAIALEATAIAAVAHPSSPPGKFVLRI